MTFDHWRGLLWLAPLTIVLGGAPAAAEWRFQVPAGWVDLSAGKPAPPGMPAREVAMARGCQVYAVDPASAGDGYSETMAARVMPAPMVPSRASPGHRSAPGWRIGSEAPGWEISAPTIARRSSAALASWRA